MRRPRNQKPVPWYARREEAKEQNRTMKARKAELDREAAKVKKVAIDGLESDIARPQASGGFGRVKTSAEIMAEIEAQEAADRAQILAEARPAPPPSAPPPAPAPTESVTWDLTELLDARGVEVPRKGDLLAIAEEFGVDLAGAANNSERLGILQNRRYPKDEPKE